MPAIAFPAPGIIIYRVGGTLPPLASGATVYRADATTTPARVARLAKALGLTGSVREDASGWSVAGAGRSLEVQRAGGLPWTLSSSGGGSVSSGCAVASPGSSSSSGISAPTPAASPPPACLGPDTVPGLPSRVDAERRARDVLTRAGFDLTEATASSTGGTDSWYVSFTPTIAGLPVLGGRWSVTVGANGSVPSASGRLADPVGVGDYPLAGVAAGVHRLEEGGKWIVYSGPVPMLGGPLGPAVPPTTGPCRPGGPCPPVSTATPVSIAPVLVTITGVHLAVAWAWPLDPSSHDAWLVPVYVFQLTGEAGYPLFGNEVPVLAVANQYLAAPPSTTMPAGVTEPGTAPAPNTAVTAPAPSTAGGK